MSYAWKRGYRLPLISFTAYPSLEGFTICSAPKSLTSFLSTIDRAGIQIINVVVAMADVGPAKY